MPVNAERQLRLERFAAVVYSLPHDSQRPRMSAGRWRSLLNGPPIVTPGVQSAEDPFETPFTDSVSYVGGSYLVLPGIAEDASEACRVLLRAAASDRDRDEGIFGPSIEHLMYATLRISDEVARRAGLSRSVQAGSTTNGTLEIPNREEFDRLKGAVRFSGDELTSIVHPFGSAVLDPIVARFGEVDLDPDKDSDLSFPYTKPILTDGEQYIVALPAGLLVALRHAAVLGAVEYRRGALVPILREIVASASALDVDRMGWRRMSWPGSEQPDWCRESFWRFDVDKYAHLVVIVDDLSGYEATDPFGSWRPSSLAGDVDDRFREVAQELRSNSAFDLQLLHLLVVQGMGRSTLMPVAHKEARDQVVVLSRSSLRVIAALESGEPLALWKFAQSRARLLETTVVQSFSQLDEYAVYRNARHSFYLADDRLPDFAVIPSDAGLDVRLEVQQRLDPHGVKHWASKGIVDVERSASAGPPIFVADPRRDGLFALLVEHPSFLVWVHPGAGQSERARPFLGELVDCVAYWIWESASAIERTASALSTRFGALVVEVSIEQPELWGDLNGMTDCGDWLNLSHDVGGTIHIELTVAAQAALGGSDNSGERVLLEALLREIGRLAAAVGVDGLSGEVETLVDAIAPLGLKKKLVVLAEHQNPQLVDRSLPRARPIQDADIERVLDTAIDTLDRLAIPDGEIPEDRRVGVLNEIVKDRFKEFGELVGRLDGTDLVAQLIQSHEAIVAGIAHHRLTLPTQILCYGDDDDYLKSLRDWGDDLQSADLAHRFILEYVAAQPPSGDEPLSLATRDYLLALSNEIINKGTLSDAIQYKLSEVVLSRLRSGRLGTHGDDPYRASIEAFRPIKFRADREAATSHFGNHWREFEATDPPPLAAEMDAAVRAEWGVSITELAHLLGDLTNLGLTGDEDPPRMPRSTLLDELVASLGWTRERVDLGIEMLSLRPRTAFMSGAEAPDIYPWRFNRSMSYVRRPLIVVEGSGVDHVAWGFRHIDRVGPSLVELILGGRLKARSVELQRFMGEMRHRDGEAFNDLVADALAVRFPYLRRRVKRVGSLRLERSPGQDIGDIDILLVDPPSGRVVVAETKNLELARTPAELRHQVESLSVGGDSAIGRVRERVEWVDGHLGDVLGWIGVPDGEKPWTVNGLIVVSRPLMVHFRGDSVTRLLTLDELRGEFDLA